MTILDFPFQTVGAYWLANNERAGLADEQGLGKSVQAIMAADLVGARRICVICPAKMRETWRHEFKTKGRALAYRQLRIMSYEEATDIFPRIVQCPKQGIADVLILDEAHYLKSPVSKRTQAIYPKAEWVKYVWALSGTPMPNDPSELWTHFYYLQPKLIPRSMDGPMNFAQFREWSCRLAPGYGGRPRVMGVRNRDKVKSVVDKLWMRRTLKEVMPQLPEMRYGEIIVEEAPSRGAEKRTAGDLTTTLSRDTYNRLIVDPDALPIGDEELSRLRRLLAIAKTEALGAFIDEELENNPEEKIVIFSWHTEPIDRLKAKLKSYGPVVVDGRTRPDDVQTLVDRFQKDRRCRVFLGQIRSAGTGLTLTAASNVIFLDLSWVPGENSQAERRILRIGQVSKSCLCRHVILKDSVDEAVTRVLARKSGMVAQIF